MNDISVYSSTMERVTGMERRKRRISEEELNQSLESSKRPRVSFLIRLESESSLDSQDDTESVYSIQDKETDVARDTSDTDDSDSDSGSNSGSGLGSCSLGIRSGDELVALEYDVASLSSDGDDFPDYTSSGTEDLNMQAAAEGAIAAVLLDSSLDTWATAGDGDTSDGSTIFDAFDFMECRRDFWTCLQCKLHNDNPSYRYCEKCFQTCWQCKTKKTFKGFPLCIGCYKVRKTFFPPRPKPSRKRKHHDESSDRQRVKLDTLQNCLQELKDNPNSTNQDLLQPTSSRIPNLNFEDIVVPQKHLKRKLGCNDDGDCDGKEDDGVDVASTRTHDSYNARVTLSAGSSTSFMRAAVTESDTDIFESEDGGADGNEPGTPRRKRCKIDLSQDSKQSKISLLSSSETDEKRTEEFSSQDSGVCVQLSSSQELTDATDSQVDSQDIASSTSLVLNATNLKRHEEQHSDSKRESDSGVSSHTLHSRLTFETDATGGAASDEMCITCTSAPKNCIFLHGSIGHMCCCYKCAMRVWRNCKRCPVCNRKVKNVVKVFKS